jgi:tetratricopeptide (TPR) repeat protein
MQEIQPELIEKYQILLQKDPKSQVFAPLTEAYRKMGMVEEAFRIAVRGVQFNPQFGGGRIALAKVFLDRDNLKSAIEELEKAVDLSPDNIMAHSILGECYLKAKRPKEALRSFKMVLFLSPNNEKAQKAVRKLESLTADEYEEDLFAMKQLPAIDALKVEAKKTRIENPTALKPIESAHISSELDRILSLADAYIVRNDLEKADVVLKEGEHAFGLHPELTKRFKLVNQRTLNVDGDPPAAVAKEAPPPNREAAKLDGQIAMLQEILERIRGLATSQFT